MTRENINWRTFDDRGAIHTQWNSPATPAYYVIDHQGIIRRKWVGKPGEKSVDTTLDELIQEAEQASR
jgi:hypothetical protein